MSSTMSAYHENFGPSTAVTSQPVETIKGEWYNALSADQKAVYEGAATVQKYDVRLAPIIVGVLTATGIGVLADIPAAAVAAGLYTCATVTRAALHAHGENLERVNAGAPKPGVVSTVGRTLMHIPSSL